MAIVILILWHWRRLLEEYEHITAERVLGQLVLDDAGEAIEAFTDIGGMAIQEVADAGRKGKHSSSAEQSL